MRVIFPRRFEHQTAVDRSPGQEERWEARQCDMACNRRQGVLCEVTNQVDRGTSRSNGRGRTAGVGGHTSYLIMTCSVSICLSSALEWTSQGGNKVRGGNHAP